MSEKVESVSLDLDKMDKFVDQIDRMNLVFNSWRSEQFIQNDSIKDITQFFFVGNAINFRFWYDNYKHVFEYIGYKGSTAMWVIIRNNSLLMDAAYLSKINVSEVDGLCNMPNPDKRQMALREAGSVLVEKYGGEILNLCEKCEWDAIKIVEEIAINFPMWEDRYEGVAFRKRAILFVAMLHGRLLPISKLKNVDKLHCLADYQVPKILHHLGILKYSNELEEMIFNHRWINYQSNFETCIRKRTIEAVDLICKHLKNRGIDACPLQLDYYLWKIAHDIEDPFHLTDTVAY